ncbi:MAG: hypothetical protein EOO41_02595 [Methanobacteriota archaeon]|nr:MAG: hypothetical protein EOO41_02595 [Euryarchaeota archaeon]
MALRRGAAAEATLTPAPVAVAVAGAGVGAEDGRRGVTSASGSAGCPFSAEPPTVPMRARASRMLLARVRADTTSPSAFVLTCSPAAATFRTRVVSAMALPNRMAMATAVSYTCVKPEGDACGRAERESDGAPGIGLR